jgi:nicotinate dehydrogenase subunit B
MNGEVAGRSITTIEGLAGTGMLHPAAANVRGAPEGDATSRPQPAPRVLARPTRPWDLSEPHERDWFGVLGDGLIVVWPPQADREWPRAAGAWVHIAPSGTVTAFTGKVDVGQDDQTAFRLLVAEVLAVDPDDVLVIQGDTDLCPYDAGTFGSRSIPGAGEALRRAAAGARQILLGLAVARVGGPRALLTTEEGAVVCSPTGVRVPFGMLVAEARRAEVLTAEPRLPPTEDWSAASRPHAAARLDVVTGARCFVSDMQLPGMLHGAVLHPPVPGAALRTVDCGSAEAITGVTVVRDAEFIGVTAGDPVTARQAVAALKADWDESARDLANQAECLRLYPASRPGRQRAVSSEMGDVEAALATAATRVRSTYTTACRAHVLPEARAAVAEWDNGRLTVWIGTNAPFAVRAQLSNTLRISEAAIRVIVPPVGGGFGGKHGEEAIEAARLARAAFQPVKVHWSGGAARVPQPSAR